MRVGIIALLQETNTFIAEATTLRHFEENLLVSGEEVLVSCSSAMTAQLVDREREMRIQCRNIVFPAGPPSGFLDVADPPRASRHRPAVPRCNLYY